MSGDVVGGCLQSQHSKRMYFFAYSCTFLVSCIFLLGMYFFGHVFFWSESCKKAPCTFLRGCYVFFIGAESCIFLRLCIFFQRPILSGGFLSCGELSPPRVP